MASAQRVSISAAEDTIKKEVPLDRRQEILEYLRLFGYKPDSTIIQVHVIGFFNRRGGAKMEVEKRQAAAKRHGGTTFVVVGRTHDPSIIEQAVKPKKNFKEGSPGYMGYLWKSKDPHYRPSPRGDTAGLCAGARPVPEGLEGHVRNEGDPACHARADRVCGQKERPHEGSVQGRQERECKARVEISRRVEGLWLQ
jgi:hypothetical protein